MRHVLFALALSMALAAPVFAQAQAPAKKAPVKAPAKAAAKAPVRPAPIQPLDPRLKTPVAGVELKDGDTLVFLGDSITHQCLYTQYIENYYYTRFPTRRIGFHNSGVGGDKAADALARFDADVAAYKPRYVTVLLGMNDGAYRHFDLPTFQTYEKDMNTVMDRIKDLGATAILMGPTMHDSGALLVKPNARKPFDSEPGKYYNAVMAFYGTWVRDQSLIRGLGYVDMFAPLNNLTVEQRVSNPNFTMVPDAVHPDANGQAVMAKAMLEAFKAPRGVSTLTSTYDGKAWKVLGNAGTKVTDVQGDAERLSFTFQAAALPWVLPEEAAIGYKITHSGHQMSQEVFRVQGLAPGKYELRIDGEPVGVYAHSLLAVKTELQENTKTPQWKQARAVAELNKEKNLQAMWPIRNLYRDLKIKRRNPAAKAEDIQKFISEMKPRIAELEKVKENFEQKIYDAAQPRARKYELVKVTTN